MTGTTDAASPSTRTVRGWAWAGLVAQVAFVLGWVVAAAWPRPRYAAMQPTLSDLYAVTAPHAWFLVVLLTLCGAATVGFALLAVRQVGAARSAPCCSPSRSTASATCCRRSSKRRARPPTRPALPPTRSATWAASSTGS